MFKKVNKARFYFKKIFIISEISNKNMVSLRMGTKQVLFKKYINFRVKHFKGRNIFTLLP